MRAILLNKLYDVLFVMTDLLGKNPIDFAFNMITITRLEIDKKKKKVSVSSYNRKEKYKRKMGEMGFLMQRN